MRLAHFSDSHLGFSAYRAVTPEGLNARGEDVAAAFLQAVERIIALRPDLVVHSGDLFDSARPSNRALAIAIDGFRRLEQAGIPTVAIAGNHDAPVLRAWGAPHAVLGRAVSTCRVVFQGQLETLDLAGVRCWAIPHCLTPEAWQAALAALAPEPGDVLVTHASWGVLPQFRYAKGNPQFLPEALVDDPRWAYVALGHYHGAMGLRGVDGHVWYAGSGERLDWAEADHTPGFVEYDCTARRATFHALPGLRTMASRVVDGKGLTPAALTEAIVSAVTDAVAGDPLPPVVRIQVVDVDRPTWAHVDRRAWATAEGQALHLDVRPVYAEDVESSVTTDSRPAVGTLDAEWRAWAATEGLDADVVPLGLEYLQR